MIIGVLAEILEKGFILPILLFKRENGLEKLKKVQFIIGPMADNDTGKIVQNAVSLKKDHRWFYDRIIRTVHGKRLDALMLGNQVVFSTERWESSLCLVGYYIYTGRRWMYHENSSSVELI